jgi:hypothetical protein
MLCAQAFLQCIPGGGPTAVGLVLYKMGADRDITVWKAHSHGNGILGSGECNPVFPTRWSPACFHRPRWRGVTITA